MTEIILSCVMLMADYADATRYRIAGYTKEEIMMVTDMPGELLDRVYMVDLSDATLNEIDNLEIQLKAECLAQ